MTEAGERAAHLQDRLGNCAGGGDGGGNVEQPQAAAGNVSGRRGLLAHYGIRLSQKAVRVTRKGNRVIEA